MFSFHLFWGGLASSHIVISLVWGRVVVLFRWFGERLCSHFVGLGRVGKVECCYFVGFGEGCCVIALVWGTVVLSFRWFGKGLQGRMLLFRWF